MQKVAIFFKLSTGVIIQIFFKVDTQFYNIKSIGSCNEHLRTQVITSDNRKYNDSNITMMRPRSNSDSEVIIVIMIIFLTLFSTIASHTLSNCS